MKYNIASIANFSEYLGRIAHLTEIVKELEMRVIFK